MQRTLIALGLSIVLFVGHQYARTGAIRAIERLAPGLDNVFSPKSSVEVACALPSGKAAHGAVWITAGFLLYSGSANAIWSWTPSKGTAAFLNQHGGDQLILDTRGRLTVADQRSSRIWRLEDEKQLLRWASTRNVITVPYQTDPQVTVLADQYKGSALNGPTDLVYKSDGALYFTDRAGAGACGVYRLRGAVGRLSGSRPDRESVEAVTTDAVNPTALAFSPTETFLYVSMGAPRNEIVKYPLTHDGEIAGPGIVLAKTSSAPGSIKVDLAGNVYAAAAGGIWIFSPEGKHLGTVRIDAPIYTLTFGNADGKTLYITTGNSILTLKTKVLGLEKKWLAVTS